MANELLDFVISLVRDPDIAARYAADPAAAIADAHLTGVTSADVGNLLPMVSDSLSMATPSFDAPDPLSGNVWTSGAATAAFDAFTPHDAPAHDWSAAVIDAPSAPATAPADDLGLDAADTSDLHSSTDPGHPVFDDGVVWTAEEHSGQPAHDFHATPQGDDGHTAFDHPHHSGFDIFE